MRKIDFRLARFPKCEVVLHDTGLADFFFSTSVLAIAMC